MCPLQVCLRSDSYIGQNQRREIKLDVKEAREIPTEHPQWDECSSEEEDEEEEGNHSANDGEDSVSSGVLRREPLRQRRRGFGE